MRTCEYCLKIEVYVGDNDKIEKEVKTFCDLPACMKSEPTEWFSAHWYCVDHYDKLKSVDFPGTRAA